MAKARRALTGDNPDLAESKRWLRQVHAQLKTETAWRNRATQSLLPALNQYNNAIKNTIGLRLQKRLSVEQAKDIAACQSVHRDISLNF